MSPWPDDEEPSKELVAETTSWWDESPDPFATEDWAERNRKWREKYKEHQQKYPCIRVYCPSCGQVYHAQRQLNLSYLMTRHNTYAETGLPTTCPGGDPDPEADKAA